MFQGSLASDLLPALATSMTTGMVQVLQENHHRLLSVVSSLQESCTRLAEDNRSAIARFTQEQTQIKAEGTSVKHQMVQQSARLDNIESALRNDHNARAEMMKVLLLLRDDLSRATSAPSHLALLPPMQSSASSSASGDRDPKPSAESQSQAPKRAPSANAILAASAANPKPAPEPIDVVRSRTVELLDYALNEISRQVAINGEFVEGPDCFCPLPRLRHWINKWVIRYLRSKELIVPGEEHWFHPKVRYSLLQCFFDVYWTPKDLQKTTLFQLRHYIVGENKETCFYPRNSQVVTPHRHFVCVTKDCHFVSGLDFARPE